MRIAMFTETYLPIRDGVVTSLLAFRRGLERLGHEVFIFTAGAHETRQANGDGHVWVFSGPPWTPYPDYRIAIRPGPSRRVLRRLGVDVVHSHGTALMGVKAVRCARMEGLPFLLTFHTRVEDATGYVTKHPAREALLRKAIWTWHRWYFNQCDAIIAPSETVKGDLMRAVPQGRAHLPLGLRHVFVIPTGIDAERFSPGDGRLYRERLGADGRKLVVSVGRVAWEKNLDSLLRACAQLKAAGQDVAFAVAGRGPALEHYRREALRLGLGDRLRFLGFVPDEELPSLYRAADAFVLPSTFETQGISILEAMAAGLPVVAANAGGPRDFIRDGENGFLFDPAREGPCAEAITRALAAPRELRERARADAMRLSFEGQAKKLAEVYEQVVAARAGS